MAEGVVFPFPSLPLNEGRTYGQPEVVLISLPQVATGLRLRLPGSFRRGLSARPAHAAGGTSLAHIPWGCSDSFTSAKPEENAVGNQMPDTAEKGESYHGDISFYSKDCRAQ